MTPFIRQDIYLGKTDWMLYSVAALLGIAILLSHDYFGASQQENNPDKLDSYMDRIITRMDTVSNQLSAWGAVDIRQSMR